MVGKVCVIGGGPSGLGVLCWFAKLKTEGKVRIRKTQLLSSFFTNEFLSVFVFVSALMHFSLYLTNATKTSSSSKTARESQDQTITAPQVSQTIPNHPKHISGLPNQRGPAQPALQSHSHTSLSELSGCTYQSPGEPIIPLSGC